ncbi:MAG: DUF2849 domain-containing protein [Rhodospirillaceae bacterium]
MMKKPDPDAPVILTANRLRDGVSVWLSKTGGWQETPESATTARTPSERTELCSIAERSVENQKVIGPYLMPVSGKIGHARFVSWRERIRAEGPTIRLPSDRAEIWKE